MVRIVPFKAWHLECMALQEAQAYLSSWVTPAQAAALEREGTAHSALDGDEVLACAGIVAIWPYRSAAWAYLAGDLGPRFLPVHRAVKRFLDGCYVKRIEATADVDFPEAHRWLELLGFVKEADRMVAYTPAGTDCALYARVRP